MLLVLLALGLPTAALAKTIPFTFDTGTNVSGIVHSFMSGTAPVYMVTGNGLTFTITFSGVNCVRAPCTFSGGSLAVTNAANVVLLSNSLLPGTFTRTSTGVDSQLNDVFSGIQLAPGTLVGQAASGTLSGNVIWQNTNNPIVLSGRLSVSGELNVPEPGTLLSLGTGLIGIAGMMRRKLKFGT
jgi:hypothetical protein